MELFKLVGRIYLEGYEKAEQEIDKISKKAQALGTKLKDVGKGVTDTGKSMTKWVTGPIMAVGGALVMIGNTMDEAMNTIRAGTGATGEALQALGEDFKAVLKTVPQGAGEVAQAIADLNTRTGLTGESLQKLSKQLLDLARVSGAEVNSLVASTTRLFGDWSIATDKQGAALDYLWKVSQSTGIGVDTLAQKLVQFGAPLRQFGFSMEEAAALMGKWEKEGVNAELVLGSLRIAMGKFAKDNIPLRQGLEQTIKKIQELGPGAEATALAMEVFGARAGPDMAAAILEGRFAIDELIKSLQASDETVAKAAEETLSFKESMAILKNEAMVALEPLGKVLLDLFREAQPYLSQGIELIRRLVDWFKELDPTVQRNIVVAVGLLAALGPLLMIIGKIISVVGTLISVGSKLGAVFSFLTGPVGLVIAAIAALVAIGVVLWKNWDTIKAKTIEIWNGIVSFFRGVKDSIVGIFRSLGDGILGIWNGIWNGIKGFVNSIIKGINVLIKGINKLSIKFPDWVPGLGGKSLGFNIPRIPLLAKGGTIEREGLAVVGEKGPELLYLPRGAMVQPLRQTQQIIEHKHTGTIRVEGVTDKDQLLDVVDIVIERLLQEVRT